MLKPVFSKAKLTKISTKPVLTCPLSKIKCYHFYLSPTRSLPCSYHELNDSRYTKIQKQNHVLNLCQQRLYSEENKKSTVADLLLCSKMIDKQAQSNKKVSEKKSEDDSCGNKKLHQNEIHASKKDPCEKSKPCQKDEPCDKKADPCQKADADKKKDLCKKVDSSVKKDPCKDNVSCEKDKPNEKKPNIKKAVGLLLCKNLKKEVSVKRDDACQEKDPCKKGDPSAKKDPCKEIVPCQKPCEKKSDIKKEKDLCKKCDPFAKKDPCKDIAPCQKDKPCEKKPDIKKSVGLLLCKNLKKEPPCNNDNASQEKSPCKDIVPCKNTNPCKKKSDIKQAVGFLLCKGLKKKGEDSCKKMNPCENEDVCHETSEDNLCVDDQPCEEDIIIIKTKRICKKKPKKIICKKDMCQLKMDNFYKTKEPAVDKTTSLILDNNNICTVPKSYKERKPRNPFCKNRKKLCKLPGTALSECILPKEEDCTRIKKKYNMKLKPCSGGKCKRKTTIVPREPQLVRSCSRPNPDACKKCDS